MKKVNSVRGIFSKSQADIKRIQEATLISQKLGLSLIHITNVISNNPARNLPYHNSQHCLTVAIRAYQGAIHHHLSLKKQKLLFLAGLYHDWDHTGEKVDDCINIERSLKYVKHILNQKDTTLSVKEIQDIIRLIDATGFPHRKANLLDEKIIQDADFLQYIEPDSKRFIQGLGTEFSYPVTVESTKVFLRSVHLNTSWAVQLLKKHRWL